jgi:hypothetical protein
MVVLGAGAAQAAVDLTTYADANGNLDIQALTCAQLANTYQEDADFAAGVVFLEPFRDIAPRPGERPSAHEERKVVIGLHRMATVAADTWI